MPNQTQPDPNQSKQAGDVGTVPFSPQSDLPPPPPDFQNVVSNVSQDIPNAEAQVSPVAPAGESGSAAPPPNFSNITSSPKKKFGTGKIIATILGVFALVGGVALATYTVGQKQLFQQKAAFCEDECDPTNINSCGVGYRCLKDASGCPRCVSTGTTPPTIPTATPTTKPSEPIVVSWPPNGAACHSTSGVAGTIAGCITYFCPNDCSGGCGENDPGVYWEYSNSCGDSLLGNYCGQIDTVNTNRSYCIPNSSSYKDSKIQCGLGCVKPPTRTNPTTPPQPTPTLPAAAPYCSAITAYDAEWNTISSTNLAALKPGDVVNFCVTGTTTSGSFDRARFIINGIQQADTTSQKPGSSSYCQVYTIPEKTTTFTISGQIHHSVLGWF